MSILKRLSDNFALHSDKTAFVINDTEYSYKLLSVYVSSVLDVLNDIDDKEKTIGILYSNNVESYASILAVWLSGRAYVPLNPEMPLERNNSVIAQAEIKNIINCSSENSQINYSASLINVSNLSFIEKGNSEFNFTESPNSLAYILFTSGSTGIPKGVPISWGNLESFTQSFDKIGFQFSHQDRFLQMFELTFDVSIASFLCPLLCGASVYTVSKDGMKYLKVYEVMRQHKITVATVAPSVLTFLLPYFDEIKLPELRYFILTAEASSAKVIDKFKQCIPDAVISNLYGPTEATIWCFSYFAEREKLFEKSYNDMICIGKPMNGFDAIITDDNGNVLPDGKKGMLCIAGNQLTTGYLNDEEKNRASFFEHALNGIKTRFYKTGDLCYTDADGDYIYCGRKDYQVKIQGYRVELSEIEIAAKNKFPVANAVAIPVRNEYGNTKVYLFVEKVNEDTKSLMEKLRTILPSYMIPAKIILLNEFPLNNSGKTDRKKLEEMATEIK